MVAVKACGYEQHELRTFVEDLQQIEAPAFFHALPTGMTPRARVRLQELLRVLDASGVKFLPTPGSDCDLLAVPSKISQSASQQFHSASPPGSQARPREAAAPPAWLLERVGGKRPLFRVRGKQSLTKLKLGGTVPSRGHYDTLRLSRGASLGEIQAAYRRAALHAHPDKGGSKELFCRVQKAFETLSDGMLRSAYDQALYKNGSTDGIKPGEVPDREIVTLSKEQIASNRDRLAARLLHMKLLTLSQ